MGGTDFRPVSTLPLSPTTFGRLSVCGAQEVFDIGCSKASCRKRHRHVPDWSLLAKYEPSGQVSVPPGTHFEHAFASACSLRIRATSVMEFLSRVRSVCLEPTIFSLWTL